MFRWYTTALIAAVGLGWLVPAALAQKSGKPVAIMTKNFEIVARNKKVAMKKGQEMEKAAAEFKKLLGEYAPKGRVKLLKAGKPGTGVTTNWSRADPKGEIKWTLEWYDPPKGQGPNDPDLMSHEAGHQMFTKWVTPKIKPEALKRKDRYASRLPDWIDEAFAVWLETDYMKKVRRRQIGGRHFNNLHKLADLFRSEHPLAEELQKGTATPQVFQANKDKLLIYYGQCMSVLEFIYAIGKTKLVRQLVDDLCAGKTMVDFIGSIKKRSLKTLKGFEFTYKKWVKSTYRK